MAKKKENRGDKTIKIRLQKSLYLCNKYKIKKEID